MKTLLLALAGLTAAALPAQDSPPESKDRPRPAPETPYIAVVAYPLETCPVSGRALGDGAKTFTIEGRELRTCCGKCIGKIKADPEKYIAKLDAAVIAAQSSTYPLTTCPVSGRALGSSQRDVIAAGTLVRTCCGKCVGKIEADPAAFAAKVVAAAYAAQDSSTAQTTCVVSGEAVDAETAVDVMYGTQLVRLCCEDCLEQLEKQPAKYLDKLPEQDAAAPVEPAASEPAGKPASKPAGEMDAGGAAHADGGAEGAPGCCSEGTAMAAGQGCCQAKTAQK